jgi:ferredoxin-nitrate reductase
MHDVRRPAIGAETRESTTDIWGPRTPYFGEWPARQDERTLATPETWVQSACVLCSNGCALDVGVKDGKIVGVRGRTGDRVNRGRLGPKGLHAWEANHSADRLTHPLVRRAGRLERATWAEAMDLIVAKTQEILEKLTSSAIGFYNTGQLMLEEYYTLAVIGKAGLGTPHMDGNTRLCTATAARALMESFGSDGQPGSYTDFDTTAAIFHIGHDVAATQTVLWARILDRRRGPKPPKLIVVDPRRTDVAKEADVHLAPRIGTNVALVNGLLHLIIAAGRVDRAFVDAHTVGFDALRATVADYSPERVSILTGVPVERLRAAAAILGDAPSLCSTVLQGVYQSHQASAAAIQVNNLHLIRGLIGKPGSTVFQMNGQPTAQNTRECGADGELPGFRNWENPAHIQELARIWNVDAQVLPTWAPPTHAMQIFRYAEEGSIKLLWVIATNPAVSMPELRRMRTILDKRGLFLVVQDAFLTETAKFADVVLPAAIWAEKTGTFTNTDRTVHLSRKAIEPPGEARSDLDIFLDYSRRMAFKDKDGAPLVKWNDPESAFEAWKVCSKGRPCDYSELSYERLSGASGLQWGGERLYTNGVFNTATEVASTFGHDLLTGAVSTEEEYRARDPRGRAHLKAAHYQPPHEQPDASYPFFLTTGRVVHHFHTRTKTGRSKKLAAAAGDAFVQLSLEDARSLGIEEGDAVEVTSRRGRIVVRAKLGDIERGQVFVPFHYGTWDRETPPRAANELTLTEWDPASKQPYFKYAAVRLAKVARLDGAGTLKDAVVEQARRATEGARDLLKAVKGKRSHVADYLGLLEESERNLADGFLLVCKRHQDEPDVAIETQLFAGWSKAHAERLRPFLERYGERDSDEPGKLRSALLSRFRQGGFGLLQDLHDVWLLAHEVHVCWVVLGQAARGLRDRELERACNELGHETDRAIAWLRTRIMHAAPQALVVPS